MRVFVTGATGFVGSHLVERLLGAGYRIFGLVHEESSQQPLPESSRVTAISGDLRDLESLKEAMKKARPDAIVHLAGQASPSLSWQTPAATFAINTIGTINVLEAARNAGSPRTLVITSAQIYSSIQPQDLPITEETYPTPAHPYGVSKWAAGQLCQLYARRHGLQVIEARPFNHIGPRQSLGFVVPDFASQLAAISLGLRAPEIHVGNLDTERDFTDVRDVVRAYHLLLQEGVSGRTYLICSGKPTSIRMILSMMLSRLQRDVTVIQDPDKRRASETPILYGSHRRLTIELGWQPSISLEQSLEETLGEWQEKLAK
ncbi:MAG: GDP-mannose 4,6-dehydratase [Candidatus Promineifilaceae bacterium]|nr:GDP-mannose 4,6-dehydratase [Candidatus Promineifilaceae bacterium]